MRDAKKDGTIKPEKKKKKKDIFSCLPGGSGMGEAARAV